LILIGRLEAERQPRRPHHASSQTGHRTRRPAAEGYQAKCALPASKSEREQQSEHERHQQCCRDRDDAVSGKMQSPEADLKSIAHSMALHLKKPRALGGQSICPPICRSVNREYAASYVPKQGTWWLQQRLDAAQQSAVLPIRCASGAPDGWLRCPQLSSGRLARRRHRPTRRSDGSPF
jgi:hypothetical protein